MQLKHGPIIIEKLQAPKTFHSNTEARFPQSSLFIADNILIIKFDQIRPGTFNNHNYSFIIDFHE